MAPDGKRKIKSEPDVDSEDDATLEPDPELRAISQSKTINFPLRANYRKWTAWEAFREIVQNW
jgi:hypothetical protein